MVEVQGNYDITKRFLCVFVGLLK